MRKYLGAIAGAVVCVVGGCKVGPDYKAPKQEELKVPTSFVNSPSARPATQPATQPTTRPVASDLDMWWKQFADPKLNDLVVRALRQNNDLAAAEARLMQVRAVRGIADAALYPQLNVGGNYSYSQSSLSTGNPNNPNGRRHDLFNAGFDASWELDLWGGYRRAAEAAEADEQVAIEARRDLQISLLAELGSNYIAYRGFQKELSITRSALKVQNESLELTRNRFKAGLTSELDVVRADAQVATTAAVIPQLERNMRVALYRLAVLCGEAPQTLVENLNDDSAIKLPEAIIPPGLPSDLLLRRPDVRRSERQYAAETARVGYAVAQRFPHFSLTGNLGQSSERYGLLARQGSTVWSIGPNISLPIFDAGRIQANIRAQNFRVDEALANYKSAVLVALSDVEASLTALQQEKARWEQLRKAVEANARAVDLANQLYSKGLGDFLNVLEAERSHFQSQDALAQSETTVANNIIALYKALGGGWGPQPKPAEPGK